jgi:hypothetical protein
MSGPGEPFRKHTTPHWVCPCGTEPPGRGHGTILSLREPVCPFCGRKFFSGGKFRDEYRRPSAREAER